MNINKTETERRLKFEGVDCRKGCTICGNIETIDRRNVQEVTSRIEQYDRKLRTVYPIKRTGQMRIDVKKKTLKMF